MTLDAGPVGGAPPSGGGSTGGNTPSGDSASTDPDASTNGDGSTGGDGAPTGGDGAPTGGDASTNGSGDAPPDPFEGFDACPSITGRTFFWPTATAPRGSLSFVVDGTFIWGVDGAQTLGSFTCAGLDITGLTFEGGPVAGLYDPQNDTVLWAGAIYRSNLIP